MDSSAQERPDSAHLAQLIDCLEDGLLERDAAVRLALLAALAGEHCLLIGPPGTAKSELARRLQHAFAGARYFERLLTRFSVPDELFGPLSLKALEQDRYERQTDGFLPTAHVAFLDEVFKANSAILNALLTLLNEREFDNGAQRLAAPLISLIGATNEVPQDEALMAFYDRFLLRVPVGPVSDAAFDALLALPGSRVLPDCAQIAPEQCQALAEAADSVLLPPDALALLQSLRAWLREQEITVSDRRWRQISRLLKIQAASRDEEAVSPWDAWVLPYCVAHEPQQIDLLIAWFYREVARAAPFDAPWLTRAVQAFEQQLQIEQSARVEVDSDAGKMALAKSLGGAAEAAAPRLVGKGLEAKLGKHYSAAHVAARCAQVAEILARVIEYYCIMQDNARAAQQGAAAHLWLPPSWRMQIDQMHAQALMDIGTLAQQLTSVHAGFAALPVDPMLQATEPPPVQIAA
ncbi:MAG: AAA family ATPase [Burkholderiaceae bacterium]